MISRVEQYGDCTFAAVSDTGINHRINNIMNQDAVDYIVINDNFALAVSDGVGSCKRAEVGSHAAVSAVKAVFNSILDNSLSDDPAEIADAVIAEWHVQLGEDDPADCCGGCLIHLVFQK